VSILASVKNQDHVLYAYQNSSQMLDSASLFLKRGLDNNESLMFITDKFSKENQTFWHHRELIRYKYGKSKKLVDALQFLESKYKELHGLLEPLQKDLM